jgi:hypothetical protein
MYCRILYLFLILTTISANSIAQSVQTASTSESSPSQLATVTAEPPPTQLSKEKIPSGSKVSIAPLNGYESFITAAIIKKQTPITIVNSIDKADYSITGVSESVQAGWAKMLFFGSEQSNEQASIVMTNLRTGVVVWGYNVHKTSSFKGKQSSSEACAKHLKARIEGRE